MSWPNTWATPSVVRDVIERLWGIGSPPPPPAIGGVFDATQQPSIAGLLDVIGHMDERIVFENFDRGKGLEWFAAIAAIRSTLAAWESGSRDAKLYKTGILTANPVLVVYRLLEGLPDVATPKSLPRLTFIADKKLKEVIARDIDSLDGMFLNGEWKAVTVIGGSAVEALLLAKLLKGRNKKKAKTYEQKQIAQQKPGWRPEALDKWYLWKLIDAAEGIALIDGTIASVCRGAKDFRNLIHPGKERAKTAPSLASAQTALAAVNHLLEVFGN